MGFPGQLGHPKVAVIKDALNMLNNLGIPSSLDESTNAANKDCLR